MPKWRKDFDKWAGGKSAVEKDKVKALLKRVFAERLSTRKGSSHQMLIDLHELQSDSRFQFGHLMIPISGGQHVKGPYLRDAYEAAVELKLYIPEDINEDDEDSLEEN